MTIDQVYFFWSPIQGLSCFGQMIICPLLCVRHSHHTIGWKSRTRVAALIVSQEQGCSGRLRIWRNLAANIWAYEQELHIRRVGVGNVTKETKALYCVFCDRPESQWKTEKQLDYGAVPPRIGKSSWSSAKKKILKTLPSGTPAISWIRELPKKSAFR